MRFDQLQRREFITLLASAIAAGPWPTAARAQRPERMKRIGVLMGYPEGDPQAQANVTALREGLYDLGWIEGRNVQIDYRWAGGDPDKARAFAKELIGLTPDVIVPSTNQVTRIVQQATRTIPIVFAFVGDPVGSGFISSLSHPGRNLTGFANFENSIGGKWLELFKEIAPRTRRVGFIFNPDAAPNVGFFHAAQAAAEPLAIRVTGLPVRDAADIEEGITTFATEPDCGLIVAPHAVTLGNRKLIIEMAARRRLPAVYSDRYFAESGGLISFGNNTAALFRRAASYVDRILKGAKPMELPVQLPTKFELIVNLKTAKAMGLTMPGLLITRADEIIE
jgi:putative tryptophan/tyrosine transport system substrate-binding protein